MASALGKWRVPVYCASIAVACVCVAVPFLLSSSSSSFSSLLHLSYTSPPFLQSIFTSLSSKFHNTMSAIKNVAVAGGTGTLGKHVVEELLKAGFTVTVLTRSPSSSSLPVGVAALKKVDYASVDSLKGALAGQDAVVSALGTYAVGGQTPLVDAALAAGVKRFVPSEFGINTRKARDQPIGKILAGKIGTVDYLIEKAAANPGFTWTGLSNGLFFDAGLQGGYQGFDLKTRTATIFDSGNEPYPTSNLSFIGRAVAAVLSHPDATANQYLDVAGFTPTQNEILAIVEEESASKWTVNKVSTADLQKAGEEKLAKGDFSAFFELLRVWLYRDGAGHAPGPQELAAAAALGLPKEDPRATIKAWLSGAV